MESNLNWPYISVIIITKNRYESLYEAVDSILRCDYPQDRYEIIILEETNVPRPIIKTNVHYKTIPVCNRGFGYARNKAVSLSNYNLLAFTDDDCIVDRDWLKMLASTIMQNESLVAVAGAVLLPKCKNIGKCENILGFPGGGLWRVHISNGAVMEVDTISTCNCMIKKETLLALGGFDESLVFGGEDELLSQRLRKRGKMVFSPRAKVYHKPRDSWLKIWKWFIRRGRAEWTLRQIQGIVKSPLFNFIVSSPYFRFIVIITLLFLFTNSIFGTFLFCGVLFFCYYFILLYRYSWSLRYKGYFIALLLVPLVRVWMDMAYHAGFLMEMYKQKK